MQCPQRVHRDPSGCPWLQTSSLALPGSLCCEPTASWPPLKRQRGESGQAHTSPRSFPWVSTALAKVLRTSRRVAARSAEDSEFLLHSKRQYMNRQDHCCAISRGSPVHAGTHTELCMHGLSMECQSGDRVVVQHMPDWEVCVQGLTWRLLQLPSRAPACFCAPSPHLGQPTL